MPFELQPHLRSGHSQAVFQFESFYIAYFSDLAGFFQNRVLFLKNTTKAICLSKAVNHAYGFSDLGCRLRNR
jgi:hypothetical protein